MLIRGINVATYCCPCCTGGKIIKQVGRTNGNRVWSNGVKMVGPVGLEPKNNRIIIEFPYQLKQGALRFFPIGFGIFWVET